MNNNADPIVLALSGGVDSAVAAALLKRAGRRVVGVTLLLNGETANPAAAAVAEALELEYHEIPAAEPFRERVILPAAKEYACGRTPNPCCLCNPELKFALLLEFADRLGVREVATGHYARRQDFSGRPVLRRGADRAKDQSYFLYRLTEEQLERSVFPLGELTKPQVRELAAQLELPAAKRPDSQDVCFAVPGENCGETLRRRAGLPPRPGRFLYQGKVVGTHPGCHLFTFGQRQGMRLALGVPAYVRSIDAATGDVALTTDPGELESASFTVADVRIAGDLGAPELAVQVRYRSPAAPCSAVELADGRWRITTAGPLRAVTPGQSAVFYCDDCVAGGGVISSVV